MKPERAFVAERAAAQHCAQLLRAGPAPVELMPKLSRLGERLARALAPALAPLLGGAAPMVRASEARADEDLFLAAELGPLAANCLMAVGAQETQVMISIQAGAVFALVDRTFGGRGDAPASLPAAFPMSADLMISRLESLIAPALAEAMGRDETSLIQPLHRDGSFTALAPFPAGAPLAVVKLEIIEDDRAPWWINLVLAEASLPSLFGQCAASESHVRHPQADPMSEPFADLPLELSAVLVDMRISMATVAALKPGSVLPVSIARNVPIRLGGKTVASGSVGEVDDCVAIRITQAFC